MEQDNGADVSTADRTEAADNTTARPDTDGPLREEHHVQAMSFNWGKLLVCILMYVSAEIFFAYVGVLEPFMGGLPTRRS